jgi:hypothetical protein
MRTLHLAKSFGEMLEEACFLTFVPIVIPTLLFLSATAHAQQQLLAVLGDVVDGPNLFSLNFTVSPDGRKARNLI